MKTYLPFLLSILCTSAALAQAPADTVLANQYYHMGDSLNEHGEYSATPTPLPG